MSTEITYTKALFDFRVKRNDTFRVKVAYNQKIAGVVTAEDITGSTFKMCIADKAVGGSIVSTLTMGSGLSITDTNKLVINIAAAQMNMEPGIYYYDIQRTYPDTTVVTRPEGRFIVEADITI